MEIDNYKSDHNILEQNIMDSTNKNLLGLRRDILSNDIEDLSSLSLEELYNISVELSKGKAIAGRAELINKIVALQGYLNVNLDEEEEIKTKKKIEEYQKEVESIDNKIDEVTKRCEAVEAEIKTRLDKESDTGELNNRFIKTFNDVQFQKDGINNERVVATVIEKDGEEIGKEIRRKFDGGERCLFRDNDGNFSEITVNGDNMEKCELTLGEAFASLGGINDYINSKTNIDKIKEINDKAAYTEEINIDESGEIERRLVERADSIGIPEEIVQEYISKIKKYSKITEYMDENLKKDLGCDDIEGEVGHTWGCMCCYVKKFCPNRFREILPLIQNMLLDSAEYLSGNYGIVKKTIGSIKSYGDSVYEYIKFCSPFDGSYMKKGTSHVHNKRFGETLEQMKQRKEKEGIPDVDTEIEIKRYQDSMSNNSMLTQYFENFGSEPESTNLFSFLKENPQTLENLGGKEIKSINLSIDSGINFAFRGIIEMVKSRPDIEFPHLNENATELEKNKRSQQWKRIIKEYESMLRDYIAKDKQENREGMKNTFDRIFISTSQGTMGSNGKDEDFMPSKQFVQQFSGSEVVDYSDDDEQYSKKVDPRFHLEKFRRENHEIKMISDIEKYVREHPTEKILVCINHHGISDGSSSNGRTKEDWIRLANISPNVKIRSIRCYFGTAFPNKEIYGQQSSISGFSNNTPTDSASCEIMSEASNKKLGFHEMEIYTRLNYPISVSPLTETMEYTDWNTGKKEMRNIGLARNDESNGDNIHQNDYSHSV